jgi:DeoR/GlpR family transcriptional regulator of sugar metabolism
MIPEERRQKISDYIKAERTVSINQIGKKFNISEITIRRDLDKLSKQGAINKVYGGATIGNPYLKESSLYKRMKENVEIKKRIAFEAFKRISEKSTTIAMIAGSTTLELVKLLEQRGNINVVTVSPHILNALCDLKRQNKFNGEIICTGGIWRNDPDDLFVGMHAINFFDNVRIGVSFLGLLAIGLENGLMCNSTFEAELIKKIISASEIVIGICDHTKFGKTAFAQIGPINLLDEIITDKELDEKIFTSFNKKVKITLV